MGYFANGADAGAYESAYCDDCIHQGDCPIWDLHWQWNYTDDKDQQSALDMFIPRDKNGFNKSCVMFIQADEAPAETDWEAKLAVWENQLPTPTRRK